MAVIRKTKSQVVATLDRLLETHNNQQAADALNALGYRDWRNDPFNAQKVISVQCAYRLKGCRDLLLERDLIPAEDLAKRFGVSVGTISGADRASRADIATITTSVATSPWAP